MNLTLRSTILVNSEFGGCKPFGKLVRLWLSLLSHLLLQTAPSVVYKLHQVLYTVQRSYARSDGHILLSGTVFVEPRASGDVLNNALRIYFVIAKCKPLTTETITHTS